MSGNLTKLEVLQHRHLNLLKTLEAHGIGAHYSQEQGEWIITNALREFKVDNSAPVDCASKWNQHLNYGGPPIPELREAFPNFGLVLTEYFAPVLYVRTEAGQAITMSHATDDVWPEWAKEKFKAVYGMLPSAWDAYYEELQLIEKRINAMLDAHGVSTMLNTRYRIDLLENRIIANDEAAIRGDAFKAYVHGWLDAMNVPMNVAWSEHTKAGCRIGGRLDWLQQRVYKQRTTVQFRDAYGNKTEHTFTTPNADFPLASAGQHISIKREVDPAFDPELDVQQEMFMCNYKCIVQGSNNEVIFGMGTLPVRTRMTPVIRNLLDALQAVIVPPSPAKVD